MIRTYGKFWVIQNSDTAHHITSEIRVDGCHTSPAMFRNLLGGKKLFCILLSNTLIVNKFQGFSVHSVKLFKLFIAIRCPSELLAF